MSTNRRKMCETALSHGRLHAALFLFLMLCLAGNLQAQTRNAATQGKYKKISLSCKAETVASALNRVERLSGYYKLSFNNDELNRYKVTTEVKDKNVPDAIDQLLRGLPFERSIKGKFIQIRPLRITTQQHTTGVVRGMIVDAEGNPLPGATVRIKGTNRGMAADIEGNFQLLNVSGNSSLIFSYIGKQSVEEKASFNHMRVTLEDDANTLDDVVITGYQDIKKEKMTGSVTTLRADKIEERYATNILNNLEGRVAGLSTYGGKMTIRGTSSLFAETSPLLVVDGLPIEGQIEDINPYDIESINVLKDAAATAIYGARASNGIIVITTKNAKKEGKIDIDFSANLTLTENRNMDYADNFYMTPAQQVDLERDYYHYYFFDNDGEVRNPIASFENQLASGTDYISPINYAYYKMAKGEMTQTQVDALTDRLKNNNYAREYADAVYRQQVLQQYNLSLRSKTNKFQSNLTLNYKYDNSGQINTFSNQLNVNYKGIYDVAKWLTASVSINAVYNKSRNPGEDYNSSHTNVWGYPAYESLYNADGSDHKMYYWYSGHDYWAGNTQEGFEDLGVVVSDEFYNNVLNTKRQHMRYHGDLLFKIIDGLTLNTQFVYENSHTTASWHANEQSHAARTIRNAYATMENGQIVYLTPQGGFLQTTNTDGEYWTLRGQANYTKSFGKHAVAALGGLEFRQTKINGTKSLALGYNDQLQNSGTHTVDFGKLSLMRSSSLYMIESGGFPANQFAFGPYMEEGMGVVPEVLHRYASGYANLTYTYDEKYNAFASFRKDYADVYGLNAKFRGKPLWSVGAGWNIHNEDFMDDIVWANFLKLRVSYGVTGNIYQGATSYMTASAGELNDYTNLPFGEVQSPANPNLKWEQNRTTNIGLDFGFLNNRITGSIDYYNRIGKDIFSNRTLDPTTGFTSMFVNMASMRNRGIEVAVTANWFQSLRRESFGWSTSLTFAHNKNEITSVENPSSVAYQLVSNPYRTGYPSSALWSYRFAGISDLKGEEGETLYYVEDGATSHSASGKSISILEYSGQSEPKVVTGMDNRFTWNGLSLSILMAYYGGHKMRALPETGTFGVGEGSPVKSYFLNAWTPENPTNTPGIGRYSSQSLGSEESYSNVAIHDADFLKIRNIVLGYELPRQWIKGLGINRLTLRFQLDNPKALWVKNDRGIDPETLGLRSRSSYIFGLNINL